MRDADSIRVTLARDVLMSPEPLSIAMPTARLTIQWNVSAGEARPIAEALHALMVTARAERGYVNCSLSTEFGDAAHVTYAEEWRTEEDLQRQIYTKRFTRIVELVERASGEPSVRFNLPDGDRGLEYAEELLGRGRR